MNCIDTFKHILSYLNNYDNIKLALLSRKINKFIRENLEIEVVDYNINSAYNMIKIYKKLKINLGIYTKIKDEKKIK
jgi:hypothetical protein